MNNNGKTETEMSAKQLLAYAAISGWLSPYLGSPRKRDLLPQDEQLKKIALAQQKRERKYKLKNKAL